jgi:hypothetical protein
MGMVPFWEKRRISMGAGLCVINASHTMGGGVFYFGWSDLDCHFP